MSKPKLPDPIRRELDATGLLWSVQPSKRHNKLYLGGRFVAALSRTPGADPSGCMLANTLATIRREARSIRAGQRP